MLASENQKFIWRTLAVTPRAGSYYWATRQAGVRHDPATDRIIIARLLERHPLLRGVFRVGDGGLEIDVDGPVDMTQYVSADRVDSVMSERAVEAATAFAAGTIDPSHSPPARFKFIVGDDGTIMVAVGHHLALDARSSLIVIGQHRQSLEAPNLAHALEEIPAESTSYAAFVEWERTLVESERGRERLAHARDALGGYRPMSLGRARGPRETHPGGWLSDVQALSAAESTAVLEFVERRGAKLFDLWMAIYATLLAAWCGRDDVGFAAPFAVNQLSGFDDVVGNMVDYLPFRVRVDPGERFESLVARTGRQKNHARETFLPFNVLCAALGWDVLSIPRPFLQAILSHQPGGVAPRLLSTPEDDVRLAADSRGEFLNLPVRTVPLELQDVGFMVAYFGGRLRWRVGARADLMDRAEADQPAQAVRRIFDHLLREPEAHVADLQRAAALSLRSTD